MIFTNLKKHSKYKDEVLKEIESAFRYSDENSFAIDFYQLIKESNLENCHLLLNDKHEFMAHIGIRPVTLHYNDAKINVLLLGGIVTKKEHQGQGHFKRLYEYICNKYKDLFSMIILWSDQNEFYEKLGFTQFGLTAVIGEEEASLKLIEERGYKEENISSYNDIQLEELSKQYIKSYMKCISIKRSLKDWRDIKKISSMKLFKNDKEYLFFEKGQDLRGIIHETSFSSNFEELKRFKPLQVLNPVLLDKDSFYIPLAWGKIINFDLFSKFINNLTNKSVQISREQITIQDKSFKIEDCELLPLLFGPNKAQELDTLIPPIYISGADSI